MPKRRIFVFGSNLAGRHGAGAALWARRYFGAQYGVGVGPTGGAYAIPTKDQDLVTLRLDAIAAYVRGFLDYANENPQEQFQVTRVGCGLAGYKDRDVAPMFKEAPANCLLPEEWVQYTRPNQL